MKSKNVKYFTPILLSLGVVLGSFTGSMSFVSLLLLAIGLGTLVGFIVMESKVKA